ncbi:hypothetical protein COLO4_04123 [Corchorus olitorius]|uniref:Uncharacterized protein n=1 Tax=Corchorus olitorius TaxID=93759 RepID=A0A1R3KV40_9ROSI|nr:hypothetical protein COLO4_04123 [Corchorus olitorius]
MIRRLYWAGINRMINDKARSPIENEYRIPSWIYIALKMARNLEREHVVKAWASGVGKGSALPQERARRAQVSYKAQPVYKARAEDSSSKAQQ